ncbi:TPA: hypothetical protein J1413_004650 [Escherichia coli]|nr:hypothetical protein [Escherichia coli]HBA9522841.1 hypothetical protein [Escherichia coli]HBA9550778.1 hypothetical protein [Escherichia coli]HBA9560245.1 hypothetical protein [Escherichia coli]
MLQFIVIFFCTLVSVTTLNAFENIESKISFVSNSRVNAYANILFQRHFFAYFFCRHNGDKCNSEMLSSPRLYLPSSLAQGTIQNKIYTCYQPLGNKGFILLTGFENGFLSSDFNRRKTESKIDSIADNITTDFPLVIFRDMNELFSNNWDELNACVRKHTNVNNSFFLVSQNAGK